MVHVMTEEQVTAASMTKGAQYAYPLLQRNQVAILVAIFKVAPIPVYFVYYAFYRELDAALVYKCVHKHNDVEDDIFEPLKQFLRACLSSNNTADSKLYGETTVSASTPLFQACRWAKAKFAHYLPFAASEGRYYTPAISYHTTVLYC